jgi:HK97 family phage prohead protease
MAEKTFRAYSLIESKDFDDDQRVIRGIATSPTVDRQGDIVEMDGVRVASDIPLFLYHDGRLTVGRARFEKPTRKGIPFEARIPKVIEEGTLKLRVDEAWQMVRYGLITAVSIGFRVLQDGWESLKDGGMRFTATEVMELSLVPVPAQPEAVIQSIKSADPAAREELLQRIKAIDTSTRAALGLTRKGVYHLDPAITGQPAPGASGTEGARRPGVVYLNES